jgi:hypothetical protein
MSAYIKVNVLNFGYNSLRIVFTTAWRVLRLRTEGSPPGTEGSCEYIE